MIVTAPGDARVNSWIAAGNDIMRVIAPGDARTHILRATAPSSARAQSCIVGGSTNVMLLTRFVPGVSPIACW